MIITETRPNGTRRVALYCGHKDKNGKLVPEPSRTKQSFKKEADINAIVAKARKTGLVDWVNKNQASYGDFTKVGTYHDAQNQIAQANELFMTIPPEIRKKFQNAPGKFLEYATNPDNHQGMVDLGMAKPKEKAPVSEPKIEPVATADPTPASSPSPDATPQGG